MAPLRFDEQAAWVGAFPHAPSVPIQIDAAAWRGRPVQFIVRGPWFLPRGDVPQPPFQRIAVTAQRAAVALVMALAAMLAWRHYRTGRGDLPGAFRLAAFALICRIVQWLLGTHHVGTIVQVFRFFDGLAAALAVAAILWILYMALEPYVWRRWPQSLISWTRVLNGAWKDRVVASHVLIGTVLGIGYALAVEMLRFGASAPPDLTLSIALGPGHAIAALAGAALRSDICSAN